MPATTLWICGHLSSEEGDWEFIGVFDSEAQAIEACTDENYFIGPTELNVRHADAPQPWPGAYIPKGQWPDSEGEQVKCH